MISVEYAALPDYYSTLSPLGGAAGLFNYVASDVYSPWTATPVCRGYSDPVFQWPSELWLPPPEDTGHLCLQPAAQGTQPHGAKQH